MTNSNINRLNQRHGQSPEVGTGGKLSGERGKIKCFEMTFERIERRCRPNRERDTIVNVRGSKTESALAYSSVGGRLVKLA